MRLAVFLLTLLLAGCSTPAPSDGGPAEPGPEPPEGDLLLNGGDLVLGMPTTDVSDGSVFLGLVVPANRTHLVVTIDVTVGASVGLRTSGVPGCDHAYTDPQLPGDPLVYECDTEPGEHRLAFRFDAGNLRFFAQVHARAPEASRA